MGGGGIDEQRLPGSIAAHNSAMDMQNKQIRQPGSQAESEIIRNCIRHRPEAEPNQSCRSALTVCWITALLYEFYHFFVFIHNVWKKKRLVLF